MLVRTDSDLFDLLQQLFGVGEFDEDGSLQWWQYRQREVSKIKRSRTSRMVTIADLACAAQYCKAHGIDIRNVTWLYQHILPALRWQTRKDAEEANRYLDEEMERALSIEYSATDDAGWYDRLVRAQDRAFVLSQWKAAGRG